MGRSAAMAAIISMATGQCHSWFEEPGSPWITTVSKRKVRPAPRASARTGHVSRISSDRHSLRSKTGIWAKLPKTNSPSKICELFKPKNTSTYFVVLHWREPIQADSPGERSRRNRVLGSCWSYGPAHVL